MADTRQSQYLGATLVSFSTRDYNSFTDRQTGEVRPGGTIRHIHLVTSVAAAPISARVRDENLFRSITENLIGARVDVTIETRAQNGRFQDEVLQCAESAPATRRKTA